jgi:hypothetical protein
MDRNEKRSIHHYKRKGIKEYKFVYLPLASASLRRVAANSNEQSSLAKSFSMYSAKRSAFPSRCRQTEASR